MQAQPSPLSNDGTSFSVTWHTPTIHDDSGTTRTSDATKCNQQAISLIASDAPQLGHKNSMGLPKIQKDRCMKT
jgi:hypothetical protein